MIVNLYACARVCLRVSSSATPPFIIVENFSGKLNNYETVRWLKFFKGNVGLHILLQRFRGITCAMLDDSLVTSLSSDLKLCQCNSSQCDWLYSSSTLFIIILGIYRRLWNVKCLRNATEMSERIPGKDVSSYENKISQSLPPLVRIFIKYNQRGRRMSAKIEQIIVKIQKSLWSNVLDKIT